MATITKEELSSIQESFNKLNEAKVILGDINTQAYIAQLEVLKLNENLRGIQSGLESKYGNIELDIATGEYKEVVEEATEVE